MTAQIGHGSTLTGASTGLIGEILNISGPNQTADQVETTSFDSADFHKDYIPGLLDGGELTFSVNYDGAAAGTANSLHTAFQARTPEVFTTVYPDTSTDAGLGFISALGKAVPDGDRITQDVTIKFSGKITFTDAA